MRLQFHLVFLLFLFLFSIACGSGEAAKEGDRLLAKVYDKNLYLSDTEGLFPEGTTKEDSALMLGAFTQRWIFEQLLMYEAERNIPKDLNIDKMVRDYRASLVRFNFEEKIIAEKLDSTVGDGELRLYFQNNQEQFQLENPVLRCLLMKVSSDAPRNELDKAWNSKDVNAIRIAADKWASISLLDSEKWYRLDEVAAFLPKGALTAENLSSRREGTLSDDGFRFYYRVLEAVQAKQAPPFEYARPQILNVILHKRKQTLLDNWKEVLYQKEMRRENVKIYK